MTSTSDAKSVWRFNHGAIEGMPHFEYAVKFKEIIEKRSNGEIEVKLYGWGELGSIAENVELCQSGGIDFTIGGPALDSTFVPEADVFQIPYLFPKNVETVKSVLTNKNAQWFKILSKKYKRTGVILIDYFQEGDQVWTSNKSIRKPDDFKGLKWRVMNSQLLIELLKRFGANPTTLPFGEIYSALQLKVIDGEENSLMAIRDMKFYEVQDYITFGCPYYLWNTILSSQIFFEKLSDKEKKLLFEAAYESGDYLWRTFKEKQAEAEADIKNGKPSIHIVRLTDKEIQPFKELGMPIKDIYLKNTSEDGKLVYNSLLEEINKASNN